MATERRRIYISRLLLLVFLPVLIVTTLHIHENSATETLCVDCVNDAPHAGHLSNGNIHFDNCLLCQFSTLPYLAAVAIIVLPFVLKGQILPSRRHVFVLRHAALQNFRRGPPEAISIF
ncbi:hypothetical protein [Prevotella sp. OH937_COT-195]|uniref:hypothetical protein n=1 Tax=Prevotella sp. OH937_COT-195 TaxID=2491051 RepID=UPI000F64D82F|nr:hypothetical protein [Prevotella sp. OH937_COT-195]RRD02812.1 hypothetical protein EII32_02045 [Prevotella sp. OH937_COT-195]